VKGEGFADIFEGNAFNNGLLPIELPREDWEAVADACRVEAGAEITINLDALTLTVHPAGGSERTIRFEVPETQRNRLLKGLDAISETLLNDDAIRAHEARSPGWVTPQTA
jgi:3-isopropylmalate/(R)-2-methylmalate dehydratase small subunit